MDRTIFYPSLLVLLLVTFPLIIWPEPSLVFLNFLKIGIENSFGTVYQLLAIGVLVFMLWIALGKYGGIRLGENHYGFSTYSWASMLFCAGVATGILYWGTIEWAYYVDAPPFGLEPGSGSAIEYAATYGAFHWGPIGWAFYSLPAIAIGYVYYVKGVPMLRLSKACEPVLGKYTNGPIGKSIDVFFMVGLLGSTGTSLGLGTPMVASGIESIFDIQDSFILKAFVISLCAIVFSISVYLGLNRGIKKLSNFNTGVAFIFLAIVLIVGPTAFIFKMSLNSFGLFVQDFVRMVTWTDPLSDSRFVEDWSIFYWAWWVAVGPFMGIFITKISGGRTIRQIVLGTIFFGSTGCAIFYGVLGNYALNLELTNQIPILDIVREGHPEKAIIAVIDNLFSGKAILVIFCLMSLVFMATSFDSTSYALASCATKKLEVHEDPARWHRLFWAVTIVILPLALMYIGGLESLKVAVLLSALPLVVIYLLMAYSLIRNLKEGESLH